MPASIRPTFIFEVALTNGTFDTPSWVNIAPYVLNRTIKVTRGRNYEFDNFEAGTIDGIVLDNSNGYFSSNNALSPYYGYIKPLKQCRLRVTYLGTTYDIFRGYITGWEPDITLENNTMMPVVNLSVTDIFGVLATMQIESYILDDNMNLLVTGHSDTTFDQQPTEYRYLAFIGNMASITGAASITGISLESGSITEGGIALNGTTEVRSSHRFISVSSVGLPARVNPGEIVQLYTWGFAGEFGGDAMSSLLDAFGVPSDRRQDIGTFNAVMAEMPSDGDTVLGRIQKIAFTEGGRVYVSKDGKATMEARYARSVVSLTGTFDDTDTTKLTYDGIRYSFDDSLLVNTVTYETISAVPLKRRYQNDASVTAYGRRYGTRGDLFTDDAALNATTAFIAANRYALPEERINSLSFKPNSKPDMMWPIALQAEISQYFRVLNTPPSGTRRDNYVFVERVEHTLDAQLLNWQTTLQLSPENTNVYFTLDVHKLDDNKVLGY